MATCSDLGHSGQYMRHLPLVVFTLLIVIGFSSAHGQNSCRDIFATELRIEYGEVERYADFENFGAQVLPSGAYSFQASLNREGTLNISAFLAFPEFGVRSHLKGSELYAEMMHHFGRDRIQRIEGKWLDGSNHTQYFAGIARGLTPEQAAIATWSGQQAARYGYSRVELVEAQYNTLFKNHVVTVIFAKPIE